MKTMTGPARKESALPEANVVAKLDEEVKNPDLLDLKQHQIYADS